MRRVRQQRQGGFNPRDPFGSGVESLVRDVLFHPGTADECGKARRPQSIGADRKRPQIPAATGLLAGVFRLLALQSR